MKGKHILAPFLCLVLVLTAAGQVTVRKLNKRQSPAWQRGDQLPKRTLVDLRAAHSSMPVGNIVPSGCILLVFYRSDCPGCQVSAPEWAGVNQIENEGLVTPVAWVNVDPSDSAAAAHANRYGIDAPLYGLADARDQKALRIWSWPRSYLITADGKFVARGGRVPADFQHASAAEYWRNAEGMCK